MHKIKEITAREIKDSRGNPTIEVELETNKQAFIASVPSGASTGENEALELRDADGKGVSQAIKNVNEIIAPKLKGKDVLNQTDIDRLMIDLDGTENKSKLGANAILGVSVAVCKAGAVAKRVPLYEYISNLAEIEKIERIPMAMFNILEGGVHTVDTTDTSNQEFIVIPQKETTAENLVICNKVFQNLENILKKEFSGKKEELGFEGGFATHIQKTERALFALTSAIGKEDCRIALDVAASEFHEKGKYNFDGQELSRAKFLEFYEDIIERFSLPDGRQAIVSIEDPFAQEDWQGFKDMTQKFGQKIIIVGDDLTTTNVDRIKEAHNKLACNGVIIKLNQIGTVSESIEAAMLAKSFGWKVIVSHRSGETMDDFIADLAVGVQADFLKAGSPAKEERMVKYKKLIEIESELNKK